MAIVMEKGSILDEVVRSAALSGCRYAQYDLGMILRGKPDLADGDVESMRWIRMSADQGYPLAQSRLGMAYETGIGVPKDHEKAAHWHRLAAERGNLESQWILGDMYWKGRGVAHDPVEAERWFLLAAAQGISECQYNLGVLYGRGVGVARNVFRSEYWNFKAAERGHHQAQYVHALTCLDRNYPLEAIRWLRMAARGDHGEAMCKLGWIYMHGVGVPKDRVQAEFWLRSALEAGCEEAAPLLHGVDFES